MRLQAKNETLCARRPAVYNTCIEIKALTIEPLQEVYSHERQSGLRAVRQPAAGKPQSQIREGDPEINRPTVFLQVMALLGVAWMAIFNYIPMYSVIIAFKEFNIIHSVGEAPWVGLDHFREFLDDEELPGVIWNTVGMSLFKAG